MRKLALILWALLAISFVVSTPAQATPVPWGPGVWGTNPFDRHVESALTRVEAAVTPMNVPSEVKRLWVEAVRHNPQGTPYSIRPGACFREMQSGTGLERRGVCVPRNVTLVPSAVSWYVDYQGTRYWLVLPDICHNWAWLSESAPQETVSDGCAIVSVPVEQGDTLLVGAYSGAALAPSRCWALRNRSGEWEALPGGCAQCIPWDRVEQHIATADRQRRHETRIVDRSGVVQVRVPVGMESHYLAFYLVRGHRCTFHIVEPSDWADHAVRFQWSQDASQGS